MKSFTTITAFSMYAAVGALILAATVPLGHDVTLNWHASVPATKLPGDAIEKYRVCRGRLPHVPCYRDSDHTIGWVIAPGTTYVDEDVKSGAYFYATTSVSKSGAESRPSNEVPVHVP